MATPVRRNPLEIVLDANVMGAFLFNEPNTALAQAVCAKILAGEIVAYVPALFWAEVQQICFKKTVQTTNAVTLADADTAYNDAGLLELAESGTELVDYRQTAWNLVKALGLGSYDAYYMALALALHVPVWTFDQRFRDPVQNSTYAGTVLQVGLDVTV